MLTLPANKAYLLGKQPEAVTPPGMPFCWIISVILVFEICFALGGRMCYTYSMKDVRITVMRITQYKDLMAQFENPIEHACSMKEGMVFVAKGGECPEGFCDSAWESLKPFVKELAAGGGNFYDGWMKNPKSAMISCNDGFRPVSFLLETV